MFSLLCFLSVLVDIIIFILKFVGVEEVSGEYIIICFGMKLILFRSL